MVWLGGVSAVVKIGWGGVSALKSLLEQGTRWSGEPEGEHGGEAERESRGESRGESGGESEVGGPEVNLDKSQKPSPVISP